MADVPFYSIGQVGVVKDLPDHEIDPRAWSDVRNIRFKDAKLVRPYGNTQYAGTLSGIPYWVMAVQSGAFGLYVYSSLTKLYATDGAAHAEVTRAVGGDYTVDKNKLWNGGTLAQIPVITNETDVPQMWLSPSLGSDFANLSNWPAGDRCRIIKPFKSFLVAAAITRGGVTYPHLVKWSHPAVPGAVPSSWDETSPTLQAGEVELVDELPGGIRDGLGLRDTFVIYKDNSTWGMQFIGGSNVFRFFPIFLQSGIISSHCVAEINNGAAHFVATGDDFIVHDGQNAKNVFNRKLKAWINSQLPTAKADRCFCVTKPKENEVWFCFPEAGGEFATLAAVYNWADDTASIRSLPSETAFADLGPVATTSDPWDSAVGDWDSDTGLWDETLFSAHFLQLISANPTLQQLTILDDETTVSTTGYAERLGLAITGQDRVTGELKGDNESMKLVDRIWIAATGAPFNVKLGAQEFHESPIVWETEQLFTPGTDKYLDFKPVNGRFLGVYMSWQGNGMTEINSYTLNIRILGNQ